MIVHAPLKSRWYHRALIAICAVCLCTMLVQSSTAQTDAFGDADPVKLFEQAQNAHARAESAKQPAERIENYNRALEYYEEAIKVRPEFPEAEYQRANALTALGRFAEAETGFRRAIELRKNWALPYSGLASVLIRLNREKEAEPLLRRSLQLEPHNVVALQQLAGLLLKTNNFNGALEFAKQATSESDATTAAWFLRALAERGTGDSKAALVSLDRVLETDPKNFQALIERGELRLASGVREAGIEDLKNAEQSSIVDKHGLARIAAAYDNAGLHEDAERIAKAAGITTSPGANTNNVIGTPDEISQANSDDPVKAREALEKLLKKNPNNAMLLTRLGASYRTDDPKRSLDYYRRALELEPTNADYATGYSSALVQARRFADAVILLKQVLHAAPDNYVAHANLATALYELKQFPDAIAEYEWLIKARPESAVAHYFIATAHDYLGEYKEALASYELFLAQANPNKNQLEIDKVKLRLPSLRRQIQRGEGAKNKSARAGKQ